MRNKILYLLAGVITSFLMVFVLYFVVNLDTWNRNFVSPSNDKSAKNGNPHKLVDKKTRMMQEKLAQEKLQKERETMLTIHAMWDTGNKKEAKDACSAMIEKDKSNAAVRIMLAEFYIQEREYKKAGDLIEKALKITPNDGYALRTMGLLFYTQNKFSQAEKYFNKTIDAKSNNSEVAWAYLWLANIYSKTGKQAQARENVAKALKTNPGDIHLKKEAENILK
jgi:Tfp pilus assembly protein PilF